MKHLKRVIAILIAAIMVLSMMTTAFASSAVEGKHTLTITDASNKHTYEAYQIFAGDLSKNEEGKFVLSNIVWGSSVKPDAASDPEPEDFNPYASLIAALNDADFVTKSEKTPEKSFVTAADVAEWLAQFEYNDKEVREFARFMEKEYLTTATGTSKEAKPNDQENPTSYTYTIEDLPVGYYLIKDKDGSLSTDDPETADSYTSFIMVIVGDATANRKADHPSVEKKVKENIKYDTDTTDTRISDVKVGKSFNDVADYSIGDVIEFELIAKLPEDGVLALYDTYKLIFNDTMSKGLTLLEKLTDEGTPSGEFAIDVYVGKTTGDNNSVDSIVTDENKLTYSTDYQVTARDHNAADKDTTIEITISDVKTVSKYDKGDNVVVVRIKAMLNENAEIGLPGNPNKVTLEYSNNPNHSGELDNETGKTPEDEVIVFTYALNVVKHDGQSEDKLLKGAEFILYRADNPAGKYAFVDKDTNTITGWTDEETEATVLTTDDAGHIEVKGLDDGTYWLKETKAPIGYNLLEEPYEFVIKADTKNGQTWDGKPEDALDLVTQTGEGYIDANGGITVKVANNKGSTLPETGGIGTYIFYIGGAALILVAGVLLVTKKRMENN